MGVKRYGDAADLKGLGAQQPVQSHMIVDVPAIGDFHKYHFSFISETLNRIELCGFSRWIVAEENSNAGRKQTCDGHNLG